MQIFWVNPVFKVVVLLNLSLGKRLCIVTVTIFKKFLIHSYSELSYFVVCADQTKGARVCGGCVYKDFKNKVWI